MKNLNSFTEFLENTVNLNKTRIDLLSDSVETIKSVVTTSAWKAKVIRFSAQGSWAHETIIRPVDGAAFDADLVAFVEPVSGWQAKDYVNELVTTLQNVPAYEGKVRRCSHCATIEYAGERKIDIAPCVVGLTGVGSLHVCNRNTNGFEESNPDAYTSWLVDRNRWSGANSFRKVTRLTKYLRDVKRTFTCPSVLLTTLLAQLMTAEDKDADEFADVPTSLRTLFGRLDDWLQARPDLPQVYNPVLKTEEFGHLLTKEQYANLRAKLNTYRTWIDEAFGEADRDASITKWRRVFGDDFAKSVPVLETKAAASLTDTAAGIVSDLVERVRARGRAALPAFFGKFSYMRVPTWRTETAGDFKVSLQATLHPSKGGRMLRSVAPLSILEKGFWLKFHVVTQYGLPLSNDYRVMWRVTNSGPEAKYEGALRGDFDPPNEGQDRWETLKYRGVHLVEAFVLRRRDDALVAVSNPFEVGIQ